MLSKKDIIINLILDRDIFPGGRYLTIKEYRNTIITVMLAAPYHIRREEINEKYIDEVLRTLLKEGNVIERDGMRREVLYTPRFNPVKVFGTRTLESYKLV